MKEDWRTKVCDNCGFSGEVNPDGTCYSSVCVGRYKNKLKTLKGSYDKFIRGGLNVGFTDDQIDFLAKWMNIEE